MNSLVTTILVAIFALALTGCDGPSEIATPKSVGPLVSFDASEQGNGMVLNPESLKLALDVEESMKTEIQNRILAVPESKKKYSILLVEPDPNVKYMVLRVKADPDKKYSILVVDPHTKKTDPHLTQYFEKLLILPNEP